MSKRRAWAWPLVPLYAAGLAVKDGLRAMRVLPAQRLAWPVVSVGSLSAGGAGKTPVVMALAELLSARGWHVDVLSRGYGRGGSATEPVDGNADNAALRFGDEPALIAQRTGAPVWVGVKRFAAGMAAEASATGAMHGVHLLDDGFQHRQLARSVDVVLVTEEDLDDALLPAGNRRESLRALRRADGVVLREEERGRVEQRVRRVLRDDAVVWSVRRELRFAEPVSGPPFAFCGIARPEGFFAMLAEAGCTLAGCKAFADHHAYSAADVEQLVSLAKSCGATGFVTTEKDRVKLSGAMLERLRSVGPVTVAALDASFVDEAGVLRGIEERLR